MGIGRCETSYFLKQLKQKHMKTLKKITLKETCDNKIMSDNEMKLVLGGTSGWTPICKTTCTFTNGSIEISIEGANSCYVIEGESIMRADTCDQDEVCILRCSDFAGQV